MFDKAGQYAWHFEKLSMDRKQCILRSNESFDRPGQYAWHFEKISMDRRQYR